MKTNSNNRKTKIVMILMAIIIIISLTLSIVMLITVSYKAVSSNVSEKEIKKVEDAELIETEMQTTTIKENISVTSSGESTTGVDRAVSDENAEYIINDSNVRKLTDADVSGLSKDQLRLARNEILARHGRRFKDEGLQNYFDSKSWYSGTISPKDFDINMDSRLSEIERANVEMIKKYE